jgi:hypothetical protein
MLKTLLSRWALTPCCYDIAPGATLPPVSPVYLACDPGHPIAPQLRTKALTEIIWRIPPPGSSGRGDSKHVNKRRTLKITQQAVVCEKLQRRLIFSQLLLDER